MDALNRRNFLASAAAMGLAGCAAPGGWGAKKDERIWALLLHLGSNMWSDVKVEDRVVSGPRKWGWEDGWGLYSDVMRFDDDVFRRTGARMGEKGVNVLVLDLGEGLFYPSHPELSIEGTRSVRWMKDEIRRFREEWGVTIVPKLNFSTGHDTYLQRYERMVSTPKYYAVASDLVKDVVDVFDGPAYFHIGYDEETYQHQRTYNYAVVRQQDLWWHDLDFFVKTIEGLGSRVWMWSDKIWHDRAGFVKHVPKSVLQSNWYYGACYDVAEMKRRKWDNAVPYVSAYDWLEEAGYDQVPTNMVPWKKPEENVQWERMVEYVRGRIAPSRLKGAMESVWCFTQKHNEKQLQAAVDKLAWAKKELAARA